MPGWQRPGRWRRRRAAIGLLLALAVVAAGAVYRLYGEDGDPAYLQPKLQRLVGLTGLDPLDPVHAVTEATVLGRIWPDGEGHWARVRLTYADGNRRVYLLPLANRKGPDGGWLNTGLEALLLPDEGVRGLSRAAAPLHLGTPTRLASAYAPGQFALAGVRDAFGRPRVSDLPAWSPRGDALLLHLPTGAAAGGRGLWVMPLGAERAPRPLLPVLVGAAAMPQWTPDGQGILIWTSDPGAPHRAALLLTDRDGRGGRVVWSARPAAEPAAEPAAYVATTADTVLVVHAGRIWRVPLDAAGGAEGEWVRDLPNLDRAHDWAEPPLSAGSGLVAYACGSDVCLADYAGAAPTRVALPPLQLGGDAPSTTLPVELERTAVPPDSVRLSLAWSRDSQALAVARWSDAHQPRLAVLDRAGGVLANLPLGPNGSLGKPQWSPDGRFVFLPAAPDGVRRILAVETTTGGVFDLSQPHWDASFVLAPDGTRLVLTNGRGSYWLAPVEYH